MGYDLHITRKENWFDKAPQIQLSEWISYCNSDSELEITNEAVAKLPNGDALAIHGTGLTIWNKYSKTTDKNKAWLDFRNGNIVVKNPDEEIIEKMKAIAIALHAKVQGDEGEVYE